jgi:hypothetical protein
MQIAPLLFLMSWLLGGMPAQTKQVSAVVMERHDDVCMGLDEAECCAQKLQIASFRATGDQLPRATKTPVRLSCSTPEKVFPETSCRLLALARGFNAKDASALCAPGQLAKRCQDDASCKQCVNDLGKLDWKAPHRACAAVTFVEPPAASSGPKVVKVTHRRDGTLVTTVDSAR